MSLLTDLALWPVRTAGRVVGQEMATPLEHTEHEVLDAVRAIHRMSEAVEHHVEVIEGLATSVGPLTQSVNELTATMHDLVTLLAPMAAAEHPIKEAEHEVNRAEGLFRRHLHKQPPGAEEEGADAP